MESIKKYLKKQERLTFDELTSLNELLKTGLSFKTSLEIINDKRHQALHENILIKLNKGCLIEEVIGPYMPKEVATYCLPLLKTMTFEKALDLSLSFCNKTKENSQELEKTILYPFVLLFVALSALYLFDAYGFDAIIEMLKSFKNDSSSFNSIRMILRIVVYSFYFAMLIGFGLVFYFSKPKNISLFYLLISKYLKDSLIHVYFCEEFVSLFLICLDLGYKTKDALNILKGLHNKPIISLLAYHLDDRLLAGDDLSKASKQDYYDSSLTKTIKVAMYTTNFNQLLSDYVLLSRNKIKIAMKKLTLIIQLSCYLVIGAIIIFIYQILFLPMQSISMF